MALLSFRGVEKRYARGRTKVVALDGVSFEVDAGEAVGVYGARRSGKSTLLRVAAGLERPDAGRVLLDGEELAQRSRRGRELRARIGRAATERPPTRNERVVDHVATPLLFSGCSPRVARVQARATLARIAASEVADALTCELSPGEQTLVAIARALVRDPLLLLVDEPAIMPSPAERDRVKALLRELAAQRDLTLVVASADIASARIAGRVWTIADGALRTSDRAGSVLPFPVRADAGRAGQR